MDTNAARPDKQPPTVAELRQTARDAVRQAQDALMWAERHLAQLDPDDGHARAQQARTAAERAYNLAGDAFDVARELVHRTAPPADDDDPAERDRRTLHNYQAANAATTANVTSLRRHDDRMSGG